MYTNFSTTTRIDEIRALSSSNHDKGSFERTFHLFRPRTSRRQAIDRRKRRSSSPFFLDDDTPLDGSGDNLGRRRNETRHLRRIGQDRARCQRRQGREWWVVKRMSSIERSWRLVVLRRTRLMCCCSDFTIVSLCIQKIFTANAQSSKYRSRNETQREKNKDSVGVVQYCMYKKGEQSFRGRR